MALRTRKPSGAASAPLILVEGAEKSGKSWACAAFTASDKVGATYWIDLGEGSADEYGAVPGARYDIVEHNGTFGEIYAAVTEVAAIARQAVTAGQPPVCLVIDSMTAEWELLKDMAGNAMRRRLEFRRSKGKNVHVPAADEEVKPDTDLWNEVTTRHYKLMKLLMTFPGIVLVTARGKETIAMDDNGRPIPNVKAYKVEGQKNLAYDVSLWVRFSRDHEPMVMGGRSVKADLRPGKWKPVAEHDLTIERLVFDLLGYDPGNVQTRDLVMPDGDIDAPESPLALAMVAAVEAASNRDQLTAVWSRIGSAVEAGEITVAEGTHIQGLVKEKGTRGQQKATPAPAPAVEKIPDAINKRMFALLAKANIVERSARLELFSEITGMPVTSTNDLTTDQAKAIIFHLEDLMKESVSV